MNKGFFQRGLFVFYACAFEKEISEYLWWQTSVFASSLFHGAIQTSNLPKLWTNRWDTAKVTSTQSHGSLILFLS